MGMYSGCMDQMGQPVIGLALLLACTVFAALWKLSARRGCFRSWGAKKIVAQRVIGCPDFQSMEEEDDNCYYWNDYMNPQASVSGLKHSTEFQSHMRASNLDVDKEEEKLLAYAKLREHDLEGFKRLLAGNPESYQEFTATYLPLPIAWLDYFFLVLGVPLGIHGQSLYLGAWATILLCLCTSQPSIFSTALKARGYYVTNQHNRLAERMRVVCAWILEVIFVTYTSYLGVVLSLLMKFFTEKRQGVMEHLASVWVILEHQEPAHIQ